MSISLKTDYSFLFSGMMSGNSMGGDSLSNLLADYASIKNGSYGKLMKEYYGRNSAETSTASGSSRKTQAKDDDETISDVKNSSAALYSSAKALLETGDKSVFKQEDITTKDENGVESTEKGYNTEKIYNAVKSFVDDYNDMLKKGSDSLNKRTLNSLKNMISYTKNHERLLAKVGISVEGDDTISIDKTAFEKADMAIVKNIFNGTGSYADSIGSKASFINMYAANDARLTGSLYGSGANYLSAYNAGTNYSSFI